jgi:hypothetical protein
MWPYIPNVLQALAMLFDEFHFHEKRGLPQWERLGHPLDTLSVLICFSFIIFFPYSIYILRFYIFFCVFSCLFITKDEFVHTQHCPALENWLHSILFILHPLTFIGAGFLWSTGKGHLFLQTQTIVILIFMFYQIIRWNIKWKFSNQKN